MTTTYLDLLAPLYMTSPRRPICKAVFLPLLINCLSFYIKHQEIILNESFIKHTLLWTECVCPLCICVHVCIDRHTVCTCMDSYMRVCLYRKQTCMHIHPAVFKGRASSQNSNTKFARSQTRRASTGVQGSVRCQQPSQANLHAQWQMNAHC